MCSLTSVVLVFRMTVLEQVKEFFSLALDIKRDYERDNKPMETNNNKEPTPPAIPGNQIRVENKLYSTEKLAELHPGGPLFIKVKLCFSYYQLMSLLSLNDLFPYFRYSLAEMHLRPSFHTTGAIFRTAVQRLRLRDWMTR